MIARATPRLRIARFFVEGFRTFRGREEILLVNKAGVADEIAVFHGPNGSGKSNALAALDTFFRGSAVWLNSGANPANNPPPKGKGQESSVTRLRLPWGWKDDLSGFELSHRNWPPANRDAQAVHVLFADAALELLAVSLTPAGNEAYIDLNRFVRTPDGFMLDGTRLDPSATDTFARLSTALLTPHGPGSTPFFRLNARRSSFLGSAGSQPPEPLSPTPMPPRLADMLFELRNSLDPEDTARWHAFESLVGRFKTLASHEINTVRDPRFEGTDLRFEIRGKQVLRLSELSSGEQQIVALCAAVLTSRAAIVAIEEPEISLHPDYQRLLREVLAEQVQNGIVDQVILESHSPIFDGHEVVQFRRSDDELPSTHVVRAPSVEGDPVIHAKARAAGADERWVTRDGYTQLPERMREQLGLTAAGGSVWFLPSDTSNRWEAWRGDEVDAMFGDRGAKE